MHVEFLKSRAREPSPALGLVHQSVAQNNPGTLCQYVSTCMQHYMHASVRMQMLVFSAWPDVLELLGHSLQEHSLPYLYGKTKHALQRALDGFGGGETAASADAVEQAGGATIQRPRGLAGRRKRRAGGDGDEEPRVLLLQLKQAAAGLNLVQAQHVLLIEPSTNPAVEAQV